MMNGKYASRSTQIGFAGAGGGHDDLMNLRSKLSLRNTKCKFLLKNVFLFNERQFLQRL